MANGFRSPGELVFLRAVEVDDDLNEKVDGVEKFIVFDKGTEKYVYTDPGKGVDHLLEVRKELYRRREEEEERPRYSGGQQSRRW